MYAIEVVPFARGILKESLTYFSAKEIPIGAIVEVPVRKSAVKALVVKVKNVSEMKVELKSADFSARKIDAPSAIKTKNFLSTEFLRSAEETARFFAGTTGSVIKNLLPSVILENIEKLEVKNLDTAPKGRHEKLVIQAPEDDRFATYRGIIRNEFAKNFSVLFIVPTIEDIKKAKEILEKGIENYCFTFHGNFRKKELITNWNKATTEKHPILVIATAQYLHLPRGDFNIIIIERENSSGFRQLSRPYIDIRKFAEIFSKKLGIKLLFGDFLLRTETVWRQKNLEFTEITPMKFRSVSASEQTFTLLPKPKKEVTGKKFEALSEGLVNLVKESLDKKENIFIFGARKGLYPLIVCQDCNKTVECPNCQAPLALHENDYRFLLCHKCGTRQNVSARCKNCLGFRLNTLGIGLELIAEELKQKFPGAEILRLDKEIAKNSKVAVKIASRFYKTPGLILCGSELALFYLNKKVDNVVCAAIDSLFSIPDFRINEKIMSILLRLRNLAQKNFLVQTRLPLLNLWQYLLEGNLADFYRAEIETRKTFNYPPFSLLIKITIQGNKSSVDSEIKKLKELFKDYDSASYPSFISKIKGKYLMNFLIKADNKNWPEENLLQKLMSLPPKFMIKVDPESIL